MICKNTSTPSTSDKDARSSEKTSAQVLNPFALALSTSVDESSSTSTYRRTYYRSCVSITYPIVRYRHLKRESYFERAEKTTMLELERRAANEGRCCILMILTSCLRKKNPDPQERLSYNINYCCNMRLTLHRGQWSNKLYLRP